MTDLPERSAETTLEDLAERSILVANNESKTFYLPPLAAQFIKTRRTEAVTQTGDALVDRAYALAMQYGGGNNYDGFRTLDAEWEFISADLPHLLVGNNNQLQTICSQLFRFLDFTGRYDDWVWLSEQAETRALVADDKENAGWQAYRAGMAYSFRNQTAEVLACATRAANHWQDSTPRNKATAIHLRGEGHTLNKDYPAAISAYSEALEIYRSISGENDDVATTLNSLAGAERANKDYTAARRDLRAAMRIAKIVKDDELVADLTCNLALLTFDRKQWVEAESLSRKALALAEKVGRQELIALDCHRIAKALLKQNKNLDEALSLSRRAVEIFTRLRHGELQSAQELAGEIEEKMNGE